MSLESVSELFILIFSSCLLSIALYLLYVAYTYTIGAYLGVKHYTDQGGVGSYRLYSEFYTKIYEDAIIHNCCFQEYLDEQKQNPEMKVMVRNVETNIMLFIYDPKMIGTLLKRSEIEKQVVGRVHGAKSSFISIDPKDLAGQKYKNKNIKSITTLSSQNEIAKLLVPLITNVTTCTFQQWIHEKNYSHSAFEIFTDISGNILLNHLHAVLTKPSLKGMEGIYHQALGQISMPLLDLLLGSWITSHKAFKFDINHRDKRKKLEAIIQSGLSRIEKDSSTHSYEKKDVQENDDIKSSLFHDLFETFGAGVETVGILISYTLYNLWKNSNALEKLKLELSNIKDMNKVTVETINSMDYLAAVVKETLRLTPPISTFPLKNSVHDLLIEDIRFRKGDIITVCTQLIHLSDKYYSEPMEFIPERWLDDNLYPNDGWRKEPFTFLSYSKNLQKGFKNDFSILQTKMVIALLMKTFDFQFPPDYLLRLIPKDHYYPIEPLKIELKPL